MVPETSPPLSLARLTEALRSQLAELGVDVQVTAGPPTLAPIGSERTPDQSESAAAEAMPNASESPESTTAGPRTPARNVLAVVWIEQTGDALVVHFYEPAGFNLRERRMPVTGTDAARIEEVAVIVRSAVSAMLERTKRDAAAERESIPAPRAELPASERKRSGDASNRDLESSDEPWLRVSLAYAGTQYATQSTWQHGASVSVAWRFAPRWSVGAGYMWLPTLEHRAGELTLRIDRHPTELGFAHELRLAGTALWLAPEGALVADLVRRRTSGTPETLTRTDPVTRWSWAASTRLRLAWQVSAPLWVFGSAGADYLLNPFEHVIEGSRASTVLSPARVRPRVHIGAAIDLP